MSLNNQFSLQPQNQARERNPFLMPDLRDLKSVRSQDLLSRGKWNFIFKKVTQDSDAILFTS